MIKKTLSGNNWKVSRKDSPDTSIAAVVPGTIHEDMLNSGQLDDPFYRDNEFNIRWIGEKSWVYSSQFDLDKDVLASENVILRCMGLDTFAAISINGQLLGTTDNMYRTWEFDIRDIARQGTNSIEIVFDSVLPYIEKRGPENKANTIHPLLHLYRNRGYVRKMPSNFNWDWGPEMITCGIWRDIEILSWDAAKLDDVYVSQNHHGDSVDLDCRISLDAECSKKLSTRVTVSFEGNELHSSAVAFDDDKVSVRQTIDDPHLWWPAGMGRQNLYDVNVALMDGSGEVLDTRKMKIGLRTLELRKEKDQWGESFGFVANGVPFFAKGSDWIPADAIYTRADARDYRRLLSDAKSANMNMIRVWGGGIYEHDYFYEICDELGLCVWQDFMFACSSYPIDESEFMESVLAELSDNIKRIRHHACVALWCGNNELTFFWVGNDGWPQIPVDLYKEVFVERFSTLVAEKDPDRQDSYWPSSPTSSLNQQYPYVDEQTSGNAHIWSVWHGKEPFEFYRTCMHRFCSEFGFQSFPHPKTIEKFTLPEERNITSRVMELHQRSGAGNSTIMEYMLRWFRMPSGFENTIWLSQIQQGLAIKYAVEHWRRNMERCRGALYWQLNDCWPVASWASIDYYGRWKALHYMAKKFYSPLLLSVLEDCDNHTMQLHVSSDLQEDNKGVIEWKACNADGEELESGRIHVDIQAGQNIQCAPLDFAQHANADSFMFFARLLVDDKEVSDNFASFVRPKHIELHRPIIDCDVTEVPDGYLVKLKSDKPALWVWLEVEGDDLPISDNYFCMTSGMEKTLKVCPGSITGKDELVGRIRINSIYDTYQESKA